MEKHNKEFMLEYKNLYEKKEEKKNFVKNENLDRFENENENFFEEITFLGTGAVSPTKYSNVSSILMKMKEDLYFMLDCGEGTFGQMMKHFGKEEAERILPLIQYIWISHIHVDHQLGIMALLKIREKIWKKTQKNSGSEYIPPVVFGTRCLFKFLRDYNKSTLSDLKYKFIVNTKIEEFFESQKEYTKKIFGSELKGKSVPVIHCRDNSFGLILTKKKRKFVYSGDTRPCEELIEAGKNADILVHEATFATGLEEQAKAKRHCTVSEAIGVAQKMKAKCLILTHFSQRYSGSQAITNYFYSDNLVQSQNSNNGLNQIFVNPNTQEKLNVFFACDFLRITPKIIREMEERENNKIK
eukprot:Anaeramoba_ignava/c20319_g2_i1.p1 GENE.c20319_g2_i1~~c20319_g2_i1.p1  ORF type:complete len:356 (+),score=106.16 c20319_g2_i1:965-2032(+)